MERTIGKLARAMAAHDRSTYEHAQRVQRYALALAREAGIGDAAQLETIDIAAHLHDIGKLRIPEGLLHKPGPLTRDEYDRVKQHAIIGAGILSTAGLRESVALLVRHHHENWDGTGYPDRLGSNAIPIGARVLSVADCYDALTSDRPYRRALSHEYAVAMILERRGSMYDPDVVDAFERIVQALEFHSATVGDRARHARVDSPTPQARAM